MIFSYSSMETGKTTQLRKKALLFTKEPDPNSIQNSIQNSGLRVTPNSSYTHEVNSADIQEKIIFFYSKKTLLVAGILSGRNFELFGVKPSGIYVCRCTVKFGTNLFSASNIIVIKIKTISFQTQRNKCAI